jgi:hypothetical protein
LKAVPNLIVKGRAQLDVGYAKAIARPEDALGRETILRESTRGQGQEQEQERERGMSAEPSSASH